MQFTRLQIIFLSVTGVALLIVVLIFSGILPGRRVDVKTTELSVWGVDDDRVWRDFIKSYKRVNANVDISYRELRESSYEGDLLDAMAAGRGPDILMFDNNWLLEHKNKIRAATFEQVSLQSLRELFPKVVEQDFVSSGLIYALPVSLDTLAMIYNKDLFDQNEIVFAPETWSDLEGVVPKLSDIEGEEISRAGASIGYTSDNVINATDILATMMLQRGVPIVSSNLRTGSLGSTEGQIALETYTDFADPEERGYTWNSSLRPSIDAFVAGDVAIFFGYASDVARVKSRSPFLDVGVADFPQFNPASSVNSADYWGLAVSASSEAPATAWDFIKFVATSRENAAAYAAETARPPALRVLIEGRLGDPEMGVFSSQALTARSWSQVDPGGFSDILDSAIGAVVRGDLTVRQAVNRAESDITDILKSR